MKYDNGERYLKEIDHVSILESIDEVFDSATSLLTLNAVMYGSTVTALIAGLPICGDLDVAVSNQEYMKLCQNFASSVKWVQVNGKRILERSAPERSSDGTRAFKLSAYNPSSDKGNPYAEAKHLPISKTATFQSLNDSRVQIIESKSMTGDRLEDALEIVRKVDFTFCGMAVDRYGRMLEAITHAYDDCNQRVIRIQDYQPLTDPKHLQHRLQKYIARGWSLTMSIDQVMANLKEAKLKYTKSMASKSKTKKKKKPSSYVMFKTRKDKKRGYVIETKKGARRLIGSNNAVRDRIRFFSERHFGLSLDSTIDALGYLIFWSVGSKSMTGPMAMELISLASAHLIKKFKLDPAKLKAEEKNQKLARMYGEKSDKPMAEKYGYISATYGSATYGSTASTSSGSNWGK